MRSYSDVGEPELAVRGLSGDAHLASIVTGAAGLGAPGLAPGELRELVPELERLGELDLGAPLIDLVLHQPAVEEARLPSASSPWKASAERICRSSSEWRSKSITGNGSASSSRRSPRL